MGLDWMLRPKDNTEKTSDKASDMLLEEASTEEVNSQIFVLPTLGGLYVPMFLYITRHTFHY